MNRTLVALLLLGYFGFATAATEGEEIGHLGLFYGHIEPEEAEVGNLGLTLGGSLESGIGFEILYSITVKEDEDSIPAAGGVGTVNAETSARTLGAFVTYQLGQNQYVKFKVGYAQLDLRIEAPGYSSLKDDEADFTYGIGGGMKVGPGSVEVNYLVLPEFNGFDGIPVNIETDMISLGYIWDF